VRDFGDAGFVDCFEFSGGGVDLQCGAASGGWGAGGGVSDTVREAAGARAFIAGGECGVGVGEFVRRVGDFAAAGFVISGDAGV
jgi:hypothetical protein